MAVASTATFELSIDALLRRSFNLAGLYEAGQATINANDLSLGRDLLGMELDSLQAEGTYLRTIESTTQALTASTASYALPSDTIDVFVGPDNVAGMIVPTSGGATPVRAISRQEYMQITNQTSESTPTLVYVEKQALVTLKFWPVPAVSTQTFRFSEIHLPRDSDTGSATPDVARRWQKAICYSMAWQIALAKSLPGARVGMLKNMADELKVKAQMSDVEKGSIQLYVEGLN
jgi:hypothetical protein